MADRPHVGATPVPARSGRVAALLFGAVLGSVVTFALVWPSLSAADSGPVAPPAGDHAPAPSGVAPDAQLARIEAAVGKLAGRVDQLDQRVETALERMAQRSAVAGPGTNAGGALIDEAAMQRALEGALDSAAQRKLRDKYDRLTPKALLAEVHRLQYEGKDPNAARQVLDLLLERELTSEQRAEARIALGTLQRTGGDTAAAEATLRDVMREQGANSELGSQAGLALIWAVRDRREALGIADGIARDAPREVIRINARVSAATIALGLNDFARARADYVAILRDCGERAEFAGLAKDVQARLNQLDGK